MPQAAERVVLRLRRLTDDRDHLGVIGGRLDERHRAERPEAAAERNLLIGAEALATEEHHVVVEHRASDLGDHVVAEVGREIDTADDRAARAGNRRDGHVAIRMTGRCRRYRDERLGDDTHRYANRSSAPMAANAATTTPCVATTTVVSRQV